MSKLILFDWKCPNGHEFEEYHNPELRCLVTCPDCGKVSQKQISAVRIDRSAIALTASASPESVAHFDRIHRQRKAIEERTKAEHGDYGKAAGSD